MSTVIYIIPSKNIFKFGFKIKDDNGKEIGSISGKTFEIDRKLTVSTRCGTGYIESVVGFHTKVNVSVAGKMIKITRKPSLFNTRVDIVGIPWAIKGVCDNYNYKIFNGRNLVAKISDEGFLRNKICVEIKNAADELEVTMLVAAMIVASDAVNTGKAMSII